MRDACASWVLCDIDKGEEMTEDSTAWKHKTFKDNADFASFFEERGRLLAIADNAKNTSEYINAMSKVAKHTMGKSIIEEMQFLGIVEKN